MQIRIHVVLFYLYFYFCFYVDCLISEFGISSPAKISDEAEKVLTGSTTRSTLVTKRTALRRNKAILKHEVVSRTYIMNSMHARLVTFSSNLYARSL